jgi:hypothetical protein
MRLDGNQSRSRRGGKEKISHHCHYRELNSGRPARSLVCILTELPLLWTALTGWGPGMKLRSTDSWQWRCTLSILLTTILKEFWWVVPNDKRQTDIQNPGRPSLWQLDSWAIPTGDSSVMNTEWKLNFYSAEERPPSLTNVSSTRTGSQNDGEGERFHT